MAMEERCADLDQRVEFHLGQTQAKRSVRALKSFSVYIRAFVRWRS